VVLNLPLIGLWVRILTIPYRFIFPAIGIFCCLGAYSASNNIFDVLSMCVFGLVGYALIKLDCEPAPLLIGFVIGPLMEENFRRAMLIARGDWTTFLTRPVSLGLLVLAAAALFAVVSPMLRHTRQKVFKE
jgi:TctA family transporter